MDNLGLKLRSVVSVSLVAVFFFADQLCADECPLGGTPRQSTLRSYSTPLPSFRARPAITNGDSPPPATEIGDEQLPDRERQPPLGQFLQPENQKVRVLMVLDDADPRIGIGVAKDGANIKSLIANALPEHVIQRDSPSDGFMVLRSSRNELTSAHVRNAIASLRVEPHDALFCLWGSHGAGVPSGADQHLSLPNDRSMFSRSELLQSLQAKNPRLAVLLIDACNSIERPIVRYELAQIPPGRQFSSPAFAQLMLRHQGIVAITAASVGEFAWSDAQSGGGLFTTAFFEFVQSTMDEDLTWETTFTRVRERTNQNYVRNRREFLNNYERYMRLTDLPPEQAQALRQTKEAFQQQLTQYPTLFVEPIATSDLNEIEQTALIQPPEIRTWTDNTGRYQVEASLIDFVGGSVKLRRSSNGATMTVPLRRLSRRDQQHLYSFARDEK